MDDATRSILGIAQGVLRDLDLDVVLARVVTAAREATGAPYAALGVLDAVDGGLAHFEAVGIDAGEADRVAALPQGRGILGELIRERVTLRLADVAGEPRSSGFPDAHPPAGAFLGVPILVAGEPFGSLYLAERPDGEQFSVQDEQAVTLLAEFAAIAIDRARSLAGSETRRIELQHAVDALDATMQISRALGGETDPAVILGLVSERARALVSARTLVIEVERAGSLELAAGSGELPAGLIGRRLPLAGTVASVALETRRSQTLSDERNRLRFERHGLGRFGVPASDGLVIPMVFGNEAHGVLVVVDRIDATPFTGAHQELLESFAASAASVLATARSATLEHRRQSLSAAEAERTRWAHELHNETLQGLAHLRLLLGVTQRSGSAGAMAEGIGRALEQLDVDIAKLRALISDLRPPALDELGIEPAVRALADRLERNGLLVDVSVELAHHHGEAPERRAPELETAVYRVVQEALTNASRHGGARHAVVEITETEEGIISLSVRDDGHGFDPSAATSGFGVLAMLERAELLGGSLTVRSATGGPSTITATLPPPRRAPEEAREPGDVIELDRSARAGA